MKSLLALIYSIADIDNSTMTMLIMIAGIASMSVRNSLVMPGLIVLVMPLILGLSMVANFLLLTFQVFEQSRLDQWVMGVIAAGTMGAILGIALTALLGRLFDRNRKAEPALPVRG